MKRAIISVNFYGHGDPQLQGTRVSGALPLPFWPQSFHDAAAILKARWSFKVVGALTLRTSKEQLLVKLAAGLSGGFVRATHLVILDYLAAYGITANDQLAARVIREAEAASSRIFSGDPERVYLITGFSAGGISALRLARALQQRGTPADYVGLADAAFRKGRANEERSTGLMTHPECAPKHGENFYQTKDNGPETGEEHGPISPEVGGLFVNKNVTSQVTVGADLAHAEACKIGNDAMLASVRMRIAALG